MILQADRLAALAMVRAGTWQVEVQMRLPMIRPARGGRVVLEAMKRRQVLDNLHHAPCCPANHYHRARLVFGRCTCGAWKEMYAGATTPPLRVAKPPAPADPPAPPVRSALDGDLQELLHRLRATGAERWRAALSVEEEDSGLFMHRKGASRGYEHAADQLAEILMRSAPMGEIAEMMLDGTMDCETGEWNFDGHDGPGWPMTGAEAAAFKRETAQTKPHTGLHGAWLKLAKILAAGPMTQNDALAVYGGTRARFKRMEDQMVEHRMIERARGLLHLTNRGRGRMETGIATEASGEKSATPCESGQAIAGG